MKHVNAVALIPARSGSKRVLNKNIKLLNGKPLLQYSIDVALHSNLDEVYVSTNSTEIQKMSISLGAKSPFLRPEIYSNDEASDYMVIEHFINYMYASNVKPRYIAYLRPTMPFRTTKEINECLEIIKNNDINVVRTVVESTYPPFWVKKIDRFGFLTPFLNELTGFEDLRSQDLPKTYICDGYVDIIQTESYIKYKSFNRGKVYPYYRGGSKFIDIDTHLDWSEAERYIKNNESN